MSYCSIVTFKGGKPDKDRKYANSWGGAAFIWTMLYDEYLKDPNKPWDSWLSRSGAKYSVPTGLQDRELWDLAKRKDLPMFERAVMASTFDRFIVKNKCFRRFAGDLREFAGRYATDDKVCHLREWAVFIQTCPAEAIGFHGTSVSESPWYDEPDDEDADWIPYDLNSRDDWGEVYEWLELLDATPEDWKGFTMSKQLELERCWNCDDPTGRAGRADDSLYDALDHGPYCLDCWNTLCESVEEDYARMQSIVDKLPKYVDTGETIPIGGNVHTTDGNGQFLLGQMRGFNFCDERGQEAEVFVGDAVSGGYWCTPSSDCYSTRAAAARQQTTGPQQTRKVQ